MEPVKLSPESLTVESFEPVDPAIAIPLEPVGIIETDKVPRCQQYVGIVETDQVPRCQQYVGIDPGRLAVG